MATVYLARDLRHGRAVAVKVLHPEIAAALGGERFLREIAIAANQDGGRFIYARSDSIYEVHSEDGEPRLIWGSPAGPQSISPTGPRWSPDGGAVYFKGYGAGLASFWVVPASGGVARLLARLDDPARPSNRPEWTTDGRSLYFTIDDRQADVWVAKVSSR